MHGRDKTTSGFVKGTAVILELYFRFRFWPIYSHRQVILHQPVKFRCNRTIGNEVMTSYRFYKMAAIESEIYFQVRFWWWQSLGRWKSTGVPNSDEISQTTAAINLLPVSENRRPPFWNSISGFYVCLIFVIGVSFCIGLPNFVKNRTTLGGVMMSYQFFQDGGRQPYWIWSGKY